MSTLPVAIVTGAARGLGLAMVERLLAEGYRVMAADLSSAEGSWNYELGDINAMGAALEANGEDRLRTCLLYTSPSPRDATLSRMPSSA